ncbi:MAG: hypothetical protein BWY99_01601 [Synergistetes bacterium ADurb.BinA166]|nr:MAG: hypothetical protein BWY99_01601 [Synergistetes bacterium ADurb.BinA166]
MMGDLNPLKRLPSALAPSISSPATITPFSSFTTAERMSGMLSTPEANAASSAVSMFHRGAEAIQAR